uniref:monogalactosyldiacylglycerol synthase n=1 Tax=Aegilops tauschii subsp. strangulata TaxID=200361 RepID=A0A453HK07_AEGTS
MSGSGRWPSTAPPRAGFTECTSPPSPTSTPSTHSIARRLAVDSTATMHDQTVLVVVVVVVVVVVICFVTGIRNCCSCFSEVVAGIMKYKPDVIISVHPLMQHIPLWVLKWQSLQPKVPFFTVITDLNTCHPTWFHHGVTRCYCPSAEVAKRALTRGLDPSQIRVYGLPIRPSFCRAVLDKDELRKELGLHPELPAVLLMGGGEGMGPVEETAKALGHELYDHRRRRPAGQVVVICGRNQALRSTLLSLPWKVPVKVMGFEKQMEKWMGSCDCIITKAGPGTIAEALIRGLPIILNDFIPGQEVGNVPYVVDNGAGMFCQDPREAARQVARWFTTETDELTRYSGNALKLAQPEAVFDIVRDIHKLQPQPAALTRIPYSLTSPFSYHI